MILCSAAILLFILKIETEARQVQGPLFYKLLPTRIEFSATKGTEIWCGASGTPDPKISWYTLENSTAENILGLRYTRSDGTLVFYPFTATDYNKDIHDTFYQCIVTNSVGTIISRKVHVRGVIEQIYNPEVENVQVRRGDTAVLRCGIPTSVEKNVYVDSWIRTDEYVLRTTDTNRTHTVLFTGELLIYETKDTDSDWGYRCQTRNRLTGEMTSSTKEAKIYVVNSLSSTLPRVILKRDKVTAEAHSDTQLPCVAEGNPPLTYSWMKDVNGVFRPMEEDPRIWLVQGTLNIRNVHGSDAGMYQCIIRNSIGEKSIESSLIVRAPLSVVLNAPSHILKIGQDVNLTCFIHGYPVHTVSWKKDGEAIIPSNRIQLLSRNVLHISSLQGKDKGMFQCFVYNDIDGADSAAELKVSVLQWVVEPQDTAVVVGNTVRIDCSVEGFPEPRKRWMKLPHIEYIVPEDFRYFPNGTSIDTLVITDVKQTDSGDYICQASNGFGCLSKIINLQVTAPLRFIHSDKEIVTTVGENVTLVCHVIKNSPIKIYWLKNQRIYQFKSKNSFILLNWTSTSIISELHLFNTTRSDMANYTCVAVSDKGLEGEMIIELQVRTPVRFIHSDKEIVAAVGENVTLVCHVIGDTPITIYWLKNQSILQYSYRKSYNSISQYWTGISTISKVRLFNITRSDMGKYTCVAISDKRVEGETIIELQVRNEIVSSVPLSLITTQMTLAKLPEIDENGSSVPLPLMTTQMALATRAENDENGSSDPLPLMTTQMTLAKLADI